MKCEFVSSTLNMGHVGGVNVKCITEIDIALGGNKYMISFIHSLYS